jgi:outer membrane protein assembly factor BamA
MRRRLLRRLLCAALPLLAAPAHAQDVDPLDRFIGRPITDVRMEIEARPVTADALLSLLVVKTGQTLTLDALKRTEDHLARDPRFSNVEVFAAERDGGGVDLLFRLIPVHPIDDISFVGETGLDPAELGRQVRGQYGGIPTGTRPSDVEESVVRILAGEGYRSARVASHTEETHNPDRATLVFDVAAGPRTMIRTVQITGTSKVADEAIRARTGALPGSPFRERAIATALSKLRDELRDAGYFKAVATYTTPPDGTEIDLELRVDAGPHVTLIVEPEAEMPRGKREDYIPIKREGSVEDDLLDDSRDAIRAALRREGYWKAEVSHSQVQKSAGELIITFTIKRGKRYRVMSVDTGTGLRVTRERLEREPGLQAGEWFSESQARAGIARVLDAEYTRQGYHQAQAAPVFDETTGRNAAEGGVVIHPGFTEGPRATISTVTIDAGEKPIVTPADVRSVLSIHTGDPYVKSQWVQAAETIGAYYDGRGFETVPEIVATLNETLTEAAVTIRVREGPQILVGEIAVVGNQRISRESILRQMTLSPGQPYSESQRLESVRRLGRVGSFRNVRISPEARLPGETNVRVVVSVEELPASIIGGGGGLEVSRRVRQVAGGGTEENLEFAPRGLFEIGRRNLGGRNRDINFFSRVALKPASTIKSPESGRDLGFNEYRVTGTYRERYAFQSDTELLFGITSEQGIRPTFSFLRQIANADILHVLSPSVSVSGRYALEFSRLFDRIPDPATDYLIDRAFPQLRLSTLSAGVLRNRRNDSVAPTRGYQVGVNGDLAMRAIGSEVGFVKGFAQGTYFYPLSDGPNRRRVVFATRGQLGLARGFVHTKTEVGDDGVVIETEVRDVPASYRFYAGGPTTVRGFDLDRLGVPEILTDDGLSNGGNAEVVLNAELRVETLKLFGRPLTTVGFVDSGQVFRVAHDLDLGRLRGTYGVGVRYDSPIGPIRLDFGFKTDRILYRNGLREQGWAYHLSIGEAF